MYPSPPFRYSDLPEEESLQREMLIELFGHYLFDSREKSMDAVMKYLKSQESRDSLGSVKAKPFEVLLETKDSTEKLEAVQGIVGKAIEIFAKALLAFMGNTGNAYKLDERHSVRLKMNLEVVDSSTGKVVIDQNINTDGTKAFMSYWGRWLSNWYNTKAVNK